MLVSILVGISDWHNICNEKDSFLPIRFAAVASQDGSIYFFNLPNYPTPLKQGWKPEMKRVIFFDDPVNFVCASPCGLFLAYTQDT